MKLLSAVLHRQDVRADVRLFGEFGSIQINATAENLINQILQLVVLIVFINQHQHKRILATIHS
ncbi:hypothetical protein [Comamonas aquatica]|jgi:hypothetical protein|uniref:hypothetical protein n=1 Tax=Comamonas aquatica TaxID=225991 RepID=UPI003D0670F7